jgi:hypothetical protein
MTWDNPVAVRNAGKFKAIPNLRVEPRTAGNKEFAT